jgi:two-component system, response regulator YesN
VKGKLWAEKMVSRVKEQMILAACTLSESDIKRKKGVSHLLQKIISGTFHKWRKKVTLNRRLVKVVNVNGNILLKFFSSYIIVLIIPLILGYAYYYTTENIVNEDEKNSNFSILKQCSLILDQRFGEIDSFVNQMEFNSYVSAFENYSDPFAYPNSFRIIDTMNNLYNVKISNNFILNYFVFFNNSKIVMNSSIVYKYHDFYDLYFNYKGVSYSQWLKTIDPDVKSNFIMGCQPAADAKLHALTGTGKTDYTVVTYMQPLMSSNIQKGYIVIIIDNKKIVQLLSELNISDSGCAYIEDKNGKIITGIASSNIDLQKVQKNINGKYDVRDGVDYAKLINKDMIVTSIQSQTSGLKYICVQSPRIAMEKLSYIHNLMIMIFIFSLLIGIIVSILLARKNSKPIKEIMSEIASYKNSDEKSDVYSYIKNTISSLFQNNKQLATEIEAQIPLLKASLLSRLFRGEFISESEIVQIMSNIRLNLTGNVFYVVVFKYVPNILERYEVDSNEMTGFKIIVKKTVDLLLNEESLCYDVEDNKLSFLFYSAASDLKSDDEYITGIVECILGNLSDKLSKMVIASVGGVANSLIDISRSYEQAMIALEFNSVQTKSGVIKYDQLDVRGEIYHLPQDMQFKLLNCLKAGDKVKTKQLLHELFTENFLKNNLSSSMQKLFIYELFAIVIKFASQVSIDDNEFRKIIVSLDKLDKLSEIEQVKVVTTAYWQVCEYMNSQIENKRIGVINDIIVYLKENYADADLSLTKVADQFKINEAYLSHLFKQQTGKNFSSYIEEMRMERAMELIKKTDICINEIAMQVGYCSSNTFCRAFKRVNGFNALSCRDVIQTMPGEKHD